MKHSSSIAEQKVEQHSWLEKAKQDIPRVLRAFWERRIKNEERFNKVGFKHFVKSTYLAAGQEWTDDVNSQYETIMQEKNDFNKFQNFFGNWFTIDSAMIVDSNHCIQPEEIEKLQIDESEIKQISDFLKETNKSAAITIGNIKSEFKTVLSPEIHPSTSFQIHSVTKMFTCALMFKMIENNIISEDELTKPLPKEFIESLPEKFKNNFQDRLSQVTILQLMNHQSGLGDYYEFENRGMNYKNPNSYQKAIIDAIKANPDAPQVPEIKQISDLLQFTEDKLYDIGKSHYSNVGITLVGLVIEYAYKHCKEKEKNISPDFDSLLQEYVLKEANIEAKNFTKSMPVNGQYNHDEKADKAAPYITAGPAGYYWTTVDDLARFGCYFYDQYSTNLDFKLLVDKYGDELRRGDDVFAHTGTLTSASSAFLSISKKGNIIAIACNNSDEAANSLESRIKRNIFSAPFETPLISTENEQSSTTRIESVLQKKPGFIQEQSQGILKISSAPPSSPANQPAPNPELGVSDDKITKKTPEQDSHTAKKLNR